MKFSEYVAVKEALISGNGTIAGRITWDPRQQAWYDEEGNPFDDDAFTGPFLSKAAAAHGVSVFEVEINYADSGHHYPANWSSPGDYDRHREAELTLYAGHRPVALPPAIKTALMDRYEKKVHRA